VTARELARPAERIEPPAAPTPPRPVPTRALTPATVLALQRTAGNTAVTSLMRSHTHAATQPPPAQDIRVVERMPTLPEAGVTYVIGKPEKLYSFELKYEGGMVHFRNLTPAGVNAKLRSLWVSLHGDLDRGREEHQKRWEDRQKHYIVGWWADLRGPHALMPEPEIWNKAGSGPLLEAITLINSTDEAVKERWERDEAAIAAGGGHTPSLQENQHRFTEDAYDVTEERIKRAAALLEQAGRQLDDCQRRLDEHLEKTVEGAGKMLRDVKITIVVLSAAAGGAGAGFAGEGAGIVTQAAYSAGTMGVIGAVEETASQLGEIHYGLRDRFDVAALGKRATRDVIVGFVGGVIGGTFSSVLKQSLGTWVGGLSEAQLAAAGMTGEEMLHQSERLFVEWIGGSILTSPFATAASTLLESALDGQLHVQTWGDFAKSVLDKLIEDGAMGLFLTYTDHAGARHGRVEPAPVPERAHVAEPRRGSTGHPEPPKRANPEYVQRPPGRRPSTGHPKPPKPPVIEESRPGGFEPTTKKPAPEDYGPAPHVEDIVLEATPKHETRTNADRPGTRKHHATVSEMRRAVRKALKKLHKEGAEQRHEQKGPREIDTLIAEIEKTDPAFATDVRRYYKALENPRWIEEQMAHLWEQARKHGRTPAEELEHILGSDKHGVNEFRNDPKLHDLAAVQDFHKRVMQNPAPFVDLTSSGDDHGAHTHAFQQYLGDRLFGPGGGLKFRLKLANVKGPTKTVRPGQEDAYEEPMYAQVWDELFDSGAIGNMHSPEDLGPILQDHLDFPRWVPEKSP
jgi:hypothetical protein